ncbi:hypothetical protein B0H14DRAFT_2626634 [Mycena olivaceomarginata]|nr:hypothetical protein B0H14DRAFT_2626634 [Mycena olivaceomarginata]
MKEQTYLPNPLPASLVLIPFIPSSILQYIAVCTYLHLSCCVPGLPQPPTRQIGRLDAAAKMKLRGIGLCAYEHIGMKYMSWKGYAHHLRAIASSIEECRRELEELRSSVLLALECARQQRYREDIDRKTATLDNTFPGMHELQNRIGAVRMMSRGNPASKGAALPYSSPHASNFLTQPKSPATDVTEEFNTITLIDVSDSAGKQKIGFGERFEDLDGDDTIYVGQGFWLKPLHLWVGVWWILESPLAPRRGNTSCRRGSKDGSK